MEKEGYIFYIDDLLSKARDAAQDQLPVTLLSFMGESRRMDNTRLLHELRVRLAYPTVATGLLSK